MGDMADWTLENELFDDGLYEHGGMKTCRYCNANGLHWENFGTKRHPIWRLCDTNCAKHNCPVAKDPLEGKL